jgi:hypothetical protein
MNPHTLTTLRRICATLDAHAATCYSNLTVRDSKRLRRAACYLLRRALRARLTC